MDSKFGEIKKKNGILGINALFSNRNNNILSILHEENTYILNWKDKTIIASPEVSGVFNSQVIKETIDFFFSSIGKKRFKDRCDSV